MKCKNCKFENLKGTKYCQNCGSAIENKNIFSQLNLKYITGNGSKGVSIAPIAMRKIEKNNQDMQLIKSSKLVKVVKKEDNTWYCPECGEHNKVYSTSCKGCGRDINS